jgi:hypothetical protein
MEKLITQLEVCDPKAFKAMGKKKTKIHSPIDADQWAAYLQQHFGERAAAEPKPEVQQPQQPELRQQTGRTAWQRGQQAEAPQQLGRSRQQPAAQRVLPSWAREPAIADLQQVVQKQLARLKADTATGPDGIPAAFIKHAIVTREVTVNNIFYIG